MPRFMQQSGRVLIDVPIGQSLRYIFQPANWYKYQEKNMGQFGVYLLKNIDDNCIVDPE